MLLASKSTQIRLTWTDQGVIGQEPWELKNSIFRWCRLANIP